MIRVIAKREYFAVVKKKSFWLSTLLFPIFIGIIAFISGFASNQADELFTVDGELAEGEQILIMDNSGIMSTDILPKGFNITDSKEESIESVKQGEAKAFFFYPENLSEEKTEIYSEYESPLLTESYNLLAENLVKSSIIMTLPEEEALLLNTSLDFAVTNFQEGEEVDRSFETFIIPGVGVVVFFVLMTFGSSFMLSSVSEEKESRMIEIILSSIKPRTLILGKLIGLLGVVITQVILLVVMAFGSLQIFNVVLPIDFSSVPFDLGLILLTAMYILLAFIVIANCMVGVGAAVPTLKEAQGLSSIFIMLSIFPIYLVSFILADPDSLYAVVLSHLPLTGAFTILFRNVVSDISIVEIGTTLLSLIFQVLITYFFAIKTFELGAFKFNDSINLRSLFKF